MFEAQETSPQQLAALVAAGKEEAKAALANADATWGAYLAAQRTQIAAASAEAGALPKSLEVLRRSAASGDAALARRKRIFIRNLKDIVRRNARSGDELVFGVNNFTHLSPKEFRDAYLTSFGHQGKAARARACHLPSLTTRPVRGALAAGQPRAAAGAIARCRVCCCTEPYLLPSQQQARLHPTNPPAHPPAPPAPPTPVAHDTSGRKLLQTPGTRACNTELAFPFGNLTARAIDHRTNGTITPVRDQGAVRGRGLPRLEDGGHWEEAAAPHSRPRAAPPGRSSAAARAAPITL